MRIGFLGIQCDNSNLGVEALAYSVLGITHQVLPGPADFVIFSGDGQEALDRTAREMALEGKRLVAAPIHHRRLRDLRTALRTMRSCEVIIDLTGGDSFSDIYGLRRLLVNLTDKQLALWSGKPLVIAPQTIGPFSRRLVLPLVRHVLRRAEMVFARDQLSSEVASSLTHREVVVATDVALALPSLAARYSLTETPAVRVGLNVSGLLWKGGYTKDNQFGLRTDYHRYNLDLVKALMAHGFEVHLVPHVFGRGGAHDEGDVPACEQVWASQPGCILAPHFSNPVDAKAYIANLDVMIGARMHATIAAFTSGIATVPVAYSRKFVGYYSNLGYDDLVDLTALDTSDAVALTVELVQERQRLAQAARRSHAVAVTKLNEFTSRLAAVLSSDERR